MVEPRKKKKTPTRRPRSPRAGLSKRGQRASHFSAMREQHATETAEDYTELIYDLQEREGEARTGQIAEHLGISHVTAVRTLQRLEAQGYVVTRRQKPVELTYKGKMLALFSKERHRLLVDFFVSIGVPREVAEHDVEGAEHHMSKITLEKIAAFIKSRS